MSHVDRNAKPPPKNSAMTITTQSVNFMLRTHGLRFHATTVQPTRAQRSQYVYNAVSGKICYRRIMTRLRQHTDRIQ